MLKTLVNNVVDGSRAGGIPAQDYLALRSFLTRYLEEIGLGTRSKEEEFESLPDLMIADLVQNRASNAAKSDEEVIASSTARAKEAADNQKRLFSKLHRTTTRWEQSVARLMDEGAQTTVIRMMFEEYEDATQAEKMAMCLRMSGIETDFVVRAMELYKPFPDIADFLGMETADLARFMFNHKVTNRMIARMTSVNERDVAEHAAIALDHLIQVVVEAELLVR